MDAVIRFIYEDALLDRPDGLKYMHTILSDHNSQPTIDGFRYLEFLNKYLVGSTPANRK